MRICLSLSWLTKKVISLHYVNYGLVERRWKVSVRGRVWFNFKFSSQNSKKCTADSKESYYWDRREKEVKNWNSQLVTPSVFSTVRVHRYTFTRRSYHCSETWVMSVLSLLWYRINMIISGNIVLMMLFSVLLLF